MPPLFCIPQETLLQVSVPSGNNADYNYMYVFSLYQSCLAFSSFIAGEDFENISTVINAHSPLMACVSINTSKDATFEPTEYFFVKLRIMDPNISFQQPLIRISILNIVSLHVSLHHSEMSFHCTAGWISEWLHFHCSFHLIGYCGEYITVPRFYLFH